MPATASSQRIPSITPASATGPIAETFKAVQAKLGVVPNMVQAMASSPAVLNGYLALSGALGHGKLSAKVREQIAIFVAESNGCTYCLSAHTAISAKLGIAADAASAARTGRSADPKTAAALAVAGAALRKRGRLDDADFAAAHGAGLDDAEIAEVIANVAVNVLTNYFNEAFRTEVDFPLVK